MVNEYIAANMIANMLGLGWAATPYGLKAMEQMKELNEGSHIASADMCTFLIINISSLQLIPVNIIAYRSQYGSVSPTSIIGMGLIATLVSTAVGIIFATLMRKIQRKSSNRGMVRYEVFVLYFGQHDSVCSSSRNRIWLIK